MDSGNTVYSDLLKCFNMFYCYIYDDISIFILPLDVVLRRLNSGLFVNADICF